MNQDSIIRHKTKHTAKYAIAAVTLLFASSLLQLGPNENVDLYYTLAALVTLSTGFIGVKLLAKNDQGEETPNIKRFLKLPGFILLISFILAVICYYFMGVNLHFLTSQLAFMLPFIIDQVYRYYLQIPTEEYKRWYYPEQHEEAIIDMIDASETLELNFVLSKKYTTETNSRFKVEVPADIPIGQLFFNLIYNYNNANPSGLIEYMGYNHAVVGWHFFTRNGNPGKKYFLDPDLSFKENNMKPNDVIYALRADEGK